MEGKISKLVMVSANVKSVVLNQKRYFLLNSLKDISQFPKFIRLIPKNFNITDVRLLVVPQLERGLFYLALDLGSCLIYTLPCSLLPPKGK